MRLLVMTVLTALAITGCASTQSTGAGGPGTGSTARATAGPSGSASATSGSAPATSGSASATSGSASAGPASGSPGATAAPVDSRCPAQLDEGQYNGRQARAVPAGIDVDWVLRCSVSGQADGHRYLLVERSDGNPAALLAALRARDEPPTSGVCPMIRMVVPYFALVQRDGTRLAPKIPLTSCRMPQAGVLKALNGLRFTVLARKQLP
jgi:hypothetical protein